MDVNLVEIRFNPDPALLLERMHLAPGSDEAEDFLELVEKARRIARPKAAFLALPVDSVDPDGRVVIGGVEFSSRLLAKKLEGAETVWPFVVSCGRELYDMAEAVPDPFERFWYDEIMQQALSEARTALLQELEKKYRPGKVASMAPGSLLEWPIQQQTPMFRLLGESAVRCGVTLTESLLMVPNKSVSGIYFPSEDGWESCSMCPREKCPNRRAKFDPELLASLDA